MTHSLGLHGFCVSIKNIKRVDYMLVLPYYINILPSLYMWNKRGTKVSSIIKQELKAKKWYFIGTENIFKPILYF